MAYDEQLAASIREVLANTDGVSERKMFGGLAFLHHGNMVCGVVGETLMLRLGVELTDAALDEPHTRPMDFTGRPMKSVVYVDPPGSRPMRRLLPGSSARLGSRRRSRPSGEPAAALCCDARSSPTA